MPECTNPGCSFGGKWKHAPNPPPNQSGKLCVKCSQPLPVQAPKVANQDAKTDDSVDDYKLAWNYYREAQLLTGSRPKAFIEIKKSVRPCVQTKIKDSVWTDACVTELKVVARLMAEIQKAKGFAKDFKSFLAGVLSPKLFRKATTLKGIGDLALEKAIKVWIERASTLQFSILSEKNSETLAWDGGISLGQAQIIAGYPYTVMGLVHEFGHNAEFAALRNKLDAGILKTFFKDYDKTKIPTKEHFADCFGANLIYVKLGLKVARDITQVALEHENEDDHHPAGHKRVRAVHEFLKKASGS